MVGEDFFSIALLGVHYPLNHRDHDGATKLIILVLFLFVSWLFWHHHQEMMDGCQKQGRGYNECWDLLR